MAAPSVHTFQWGIFDVAYEAPKRSFSPSYPLTLLRSFREPGIHVWRFLKDVYRVAPVTFSVYIGSSIWLSISPAVSLQLSYIILQKLEDLANHRNIQCAQSIQTEVMLRVCVLLFCAFMSVIADRLRDERELSLCSHLRSHYLPPIVRASLNADVTFLHDNDIRRCFPSASSFCEGGPGWNLLKALAEHLQNLGSLVFELAVLLSVLLQRNYFDKCFFGGVTCVFFFVLVHSPSNGAGGAGYTFWTTNVAYHHLSSLYSIIFGDKIRETLAKDGVNDFLCEEYSKHSEDLGVVKCDALTLACVLPPPWYWAAVRSLFLDYPMTICALLLVWSPSPHILATLMFFQSATHALRCSMERLRYGCNIRSLSSLFAQAEALYKPLDRDQKNQRTAAMSYPNPSFGSTGGMGIQLRDVTFNYRNAGGHAALRKVTLTIPASSLVLLVGENGSGKTTLLKLLARLQAPTSGDILIDDHPVTNYDILSIRKHITFLMQTEEIYPLSLRENLLMVVPGRKSLDEKIKEKMDEAIRLGGSEALIERVGFEAVLDPPCLLGQSLQGCGNGTIGPAALRELEKHMLRRPLPISTGEKQRFLASRSFMRLLNSDTRLLMIDEPTSALDPIAERDLFERFREKRRAKTAIFVTHRFANIAKRADLIVCMKNGGVIEQGRHEELMTLGGEYAKLYDAQRIQEPH